MATKKGFQSILCDVASCRFNEMNQECTLDGIKVSHCHNASSGTPEDESMCGSYSKR